MESSRNCAGKSTEPSAARRRSRRWGASEEAEAAIIFGADEPFAKSAQIGSVAPFMTALRFLNPCLAAAFAAAILAACVSPPKPTIPPAKPTPKPVGWWKDEGAQGPSSIIVDLSEQRAYFYKGDVVVGEAKCSSGKKSFATPAGEYKVTQRNKNHVSNLYGKILDVEGNVVISDADMGKHKVPEGGSFAGAKMPFYLRFHNGYGMHAGRVPNYPASHGCVRLPRFMAEHFFSHSVIGTPVTVRE